MVLADSTMDKVNLPFFYQLGTQLSPLTKMAVESQTRLSILLACVPVRDSINGLLTWSGGLNVCLNSAQALLKTMDEVAHWWFTAKPEDQQKTDVLVDSKFMRVVQTAIKFETVLNEELATLATYSVSKKGIYSTPDLIDTTEKAFPESALSKLSPDIIREIQEAGKCLAFDIPTASGFHMLRATEAVLHEYYLAIGEPQKKDKLENWGAYISYLYKLAESETEIDEEKVNHIKKVLALLQQVKDRDRNLIMHPEVVLSADEAFMLFETTKTAIMTMADKLPPYQPIDIAKVEPPKFTKIEAVEPPKLVKIEAVEPPKFAKVKAIRKDKTTKKE
jgi:hypothetical protein